MQQISKIRQILISHAPSPIPRLLTQRMSRVMVDCIRRLDVRSGEAIEVDRIELRLIRLGSGIELISYPANKSERKVLGWLAKELKLDPSYAKVLLDAVTRYTYPHVGGACLKMDSPKSERFMFHPQHWNFVLEEDGISDDRKNEIANLFRPQPGWHCLDIGAFLGHGATWLRQQIGETGKIICVEANQQNRMVLDEGMRRNHFANVESRFAAIWHTAGETVTFNLTQRQGNAIDSEVVAGTSTVDVPTVSIASLTEELGQAADLVSLTVNGAEVEAIEGLKAMSPDQYPKRLIAPGWYLKDGQPRAQWLKKMFDEFGYRSFFTEGLLGVAWLESVDNAVA